MQIHDRYTQPSDSDGIALLCAEHPVPHWYARPYWWVRTMWSRFRMYWFSADYFEEREIELGDE